MRRMFWRRGPLRHVYGRERTGGRDCRRPAAASAPVFTAAQAAAGRGLYDASCAGCHVADLGGRNEAPQLAGGDFMNAWRTRTTLDLFEFIQATMPPGGPTLSADQYLSDHVRSSCSEMAPRPARSRSTATTALPIGSAAGPRRAAPAAGISR